MDSKEYAYKLRTVKIGESLYKACFPTDHSRVEGLVCHSWDSHADDQYANIPNYRTLCFVRWKGEKEWEKLYEGPSQNFEVAGTSFPLHSAGIFRILFALESEKVRKSYLRKKEIAGLRQKIRNDTKRLEDLLGSARK